MKSNHSTGLHLFQLLSLKHMELPAELSLSRPLNAIFCTRLQNYLFAHLVNYRKILGKFRSGGVKRKIPLLTLETEITDDKDFEPEASERKRQKLSPDPDLLDELQSLNESISIPTSENALSTGDINDIMSSSEGVDTLTFGPKSSKRGRGRPFGSVKPIGPKKLGDGSVTSKSTREGYTLEYRTLPGKPRIVVTPKLLDKTPDEATDSAVTEESNTEDPSSPKPDSENPETSIENMESDTVVGVRKSDSDEGTVALTKSQIQKVLSNLPPGISVTPAMGCDSEEINKLISDKNKLDASSSTQSTDKAGKKLPDYLELVAVTMADGYTIEYRLMPKKPESTKIPEDNVTSVTTCTDTISATEISDETTTAGIKWPLGVKPSSGNENQAEGNESQVQLSIDESGQVIFIP